MKSDYSHPFQYPTSDRINKNEITLFMQLQHWSRYEWKLEIALLNDKATLFSDHYSRIDFPPYLYSGIMVELWLAIEAPTKCCRFSDNTDNSGNLFAVIQRLVNLGIA